MTLSLALRVNQMDFVMDKQHWLIGTVMANLVCRFVFHRSVGGLFLRRIFSWFWFYMNWMIFIIMGLPFRLSIGHRGLGNS